MWQTIRTMPISVLHDPVVSALLAAGLCLLLAALFAFLAGRGVRRELHGALAVVICVFALQMVGHAGYLAGPAPEGHLYWSRLVVATTLLLVPPWLWLVRAAAGKPSRRALLAWSVGALVLLTTVGTTAMLGVDKIPGHHAGVYSDLLEGPLYWPHLIYTGAGALTGLGHGIAAVRRHKGRLPNLSGSLRPVIVVGSVPLSLLVIYALNVFGLLEEKIPFAWVAFGVVLVLSAGLLEAFVATHEGLEKEHAQVLVLNEELEERRKRELELAAEKQRLLTEEVVLLRHELEEQSGETRLLGSSQAIAALRDLIRRLAPLETTVLITGETGTGKELVARELHARSTRTGGPFVAANVAALPETLLEAELFGHEAGAFTGASKPRAGLFERADGGTLFLDEIGDASGALQAKLLRVIQERVVSRVGSGLDIPVDVRLVAATHRDLEAVQREGKFRADLYYRLNVVRVEVPPLRARAEDIPQLAEHFLRQHASRQSKALQGFTLGALDALTRHPWPGNVRELENAVERALTLAEGDRIRLADLPPGIRQRTVTTETPGGKNAGNAPFFIQGEPTLQELEGRYIDHVLSLCGGNRAEAARRLQIGERTLYRRLQEKQGNSGTNS